MRQAELTLDEMLADPIVHLVMRRDGVEEQQVRQLIALARQRCRAANDADAPLLRPAASF